MASRRHSLHSELQRDNPATNSSEVALQPLLSSNHGSRCHNYDLEESSVDHASTYSAPRQPETTAKQEYSTSKAEEDLLAYVQQPTRSWSPFVLQWQCLYAYLCTYCLLIMVIAILVVIDDRHQGLATSNERWSYFWTYGPTLGIVHLVPQKYSCCY